MRILLNNFFQSQCFFILIICNTIWLKTSSSSPLSSAWSRWWWLSWKYLSPTQPVLAGGRKSGRAKQALLAATDRKYFTNIDKYWKPLLENILLSFSGWFSSDAKHGKFPEILWYVVIVSILNSSNLHKKSLSGKKTIGWLWCCSNQPHSFPHLYQHQHQLY